MFIRFDMIHERDRQTDRRTDRRTDTACRHRPRLCIAIARQKWQRLPAGCTLRSVWPAVAI